MSPVPPLAPVIQIDWLSDANEAITDEGAIF
jgi:hypothetical protein